MPRSRPKPVTWESIVDTLYSQNYRYQLRKFVGQSAYIKIWDKQKKKTYSANPLSYLVIEDVINAKKIVEWLGEKEFPIEETIPSLLEKIDKGEEYSEEETYNWTILLRWVDTHLTKTMKQTSAKNIRGLINNAANQDLPLTWKSFKGWLFQKPIDSRPFKNRLDALEQLRLAVSGRVGDEPSWLTRHNLMELRQQNNASTLKKKRYQPNNDVSTVRAIPTKEQAEKYFDANYKKYPLAIWCLIMMHCYGFRNHELWHCSPMNEDETGDSFKDSMIYVPGNWRTKSFEHYAFPIYPDWVEKYSLIDLLHDNQEILHRRARPKIVSAKDMSKPWTGIDPSDLGVCTNNDYLGNWITKRFKEVLPEWKASVPNKTGAYISNAKKEQVKPYDLRHTWAIRISTMPEWSHVSESDAALAMGHSIEVHRRNYQRWISIEETRDSFIKRITAPNAA